MEGVNPPNWSEGDPHCGAQAGYESTASAAAPRLGAGGGRDLSDPGFSRFREHRNLTLCLPPTALPSKAVYRF